MLILNHLSEKHIAAAIERGELSNLPGAGKPLELDDDALIPHELRLAHRILKNAGFVPPAVERLREIHDLRQLISTLEDDGARHHAIIRLNLLMAQTTAGRRHGDLRIEEAYVEKITERLTST